MDTQKGNKLIAEFMGASPNKRILSGRETTFWEGGECPKLMLDSAPSTRELRFHRDWNWLIPVVEKLFGILDKEKSSHPKFYDTIKHISVHLIQGHIGEVWLTCVRCIEWYDKQKVWKSPEESPYLYKREERYV